MKNPYDTLGVTRNASSDEIKKAYRKLAKELHPDLHPDNKRVAERFKEVSAAYNLLSNPENRAKFDQGGMNADGSTNGFSGFKDVYRQYQRTHAGGRANTGGRGGFGGFDFNPEDLFSDVFSGRRQAHQETRGQRGADRIYKVTIDFMDAIKGTKRRITLENGKTLDVKIPVNVKEGQQIRLKGQGGKGIGGGADGNALIEVEIAPHEYFRHEGNDIHLDLPITLDEAVMGGKVNVPTIDGKVTLNIPAGSSSGKILRLKGKGVAGSNSSTRGDQYVKLQITLPDTIDPDLKKAVESWSRKHRYEVRSKLK